MVVGLDPGKNIGVAIVNSKEKLIYRNIITLEELRGLELPPGITIIVGNGTGSDRVQAALRERGKTFALIDERDTTLEGRELYFQANPPRGLLRLLPKGLRSPPRLIDDYAAYAIALRFLRQNYLD